MPTPLSPAKAVITQLHRTKREMVEIEQARYNEPPSSYRGTRGGLGAPENQGSSSMSAVVDPPQGRSSSAFTCCGVRISAYSPDDAVRVLVSDARERQVYGVHLCNAYTLSLAAKDGAYASALNRAGHNLADGTPVAWLGRRSGHKQMTTSVRGPSLMLAVMEAGLPFGLRHYLYGGTPAVAQALQQALTSAMPTLQIVGVESPPFHALAEEELTETVSRVQLSEAHFVWVGLGTPKQDLFVAWATDDHLPTITIAVGAAFDFISGNVREAPKWLHGTGLEWLYRFALEPRRLWRRYLIGNMVFSKAAATDLCRSARLHQRWPRR